MIVQRTDLKTGKTYIHRNAQITITNNSVTLLGPRSGGIAEGILTSFTFLKHNAVASTEARLNLDILRRQGISERYVMEYWYVEIKEES